MPFTDFEYMWVIGCHILTPSVNTLSIHCVGLARTLGLLELNSFVRSFVYSFDRSFESIQDQAGALPRVTTANLQITPK